MIPSFRPSYDFLAPQRIVFGWGRRVEVGKLAAALGTRAFIVSGSSTLERSGAVGEVCDALSRAGVKPIRPDIPIQRREPEVDDVDRAARALRALGPGKGDIVVALGGGSAMDLAKAACAMAVNSRSETVKDYLEGVGKGLGIEVEPLPLLALPATAGTGSEATKNAVISSRDPPFKKSLRSDSMVPRAVIVDPELTVSVPPRITAATGMDAITQLIESYISLRAAPIPQALAIHGLALAAGAITRAVEDGKDRDARERMAHAALLSGMALANSGLGMAHGVAAALGIHAGIAHGLACAVMLPAALRANAAARPREISRIGEVMCGARFDSDEDGVRAAIERVEDLCRRVEIPGKLRDLGVKKEDLPAIAASSRGNSMSGNPREISDEELSRILEEMF